jgi:hypothetical protein
MRSKQKVSINVEQISSLLPSSQSVLPVETNFVGESLLDKQEMVHQHKILSAGSKVLRQWKRKKFAKVIYALALAGCVLLAPLSPTLLVSAATAVSVVDSSVTGKVVNLPIAGTNVNWVITANQENSHVMLVSLENVCKISAVGCTLASGSTSVNYAVWNGDAAGLNCASGVGYCNQIVTFPKTYNYLQQMTNVYANLPATIGGIAKNSVILNKSWDMDGFSTTNPGIAAVRSAGNANVVSRVNLPSAYEWQEGLDDGARAPTISFNFDEPLDNSVGDLWCRADYGTAGTDVNGGANRDCVGSSHSVSDYWWLRSTHSADTGSVWHFSGVSPNSLSSKRAIETQGLFPAIWLSGAVCIGGSGGTRNYPYSLAECPLAIITTTGSTAAGITLSGIAKASGNNQAITVWADACNSAGQCVRKTYSGFTSASSATAQNWTLTWTAGELPAGTYSGVIWAGLTVVTVGSDNVFAQSGTINFTISPKVRTMRMTVIKSKAFSLNVGPVGDFDIALGTNNGVTAGSSSNNLVLSSTSGLASNTTATFGNSKFEITVIDPPQPTITNVSLE